MSTWIIEEQDDGGFDILRNGRAFMYGLDDDGEALDAIRRDSRYSPDDKIYEEDFSGSRRKLSVR